MNAKQREELKHLRIWLAHHLRHYHGMTYKQIGTFMGAKSGAIAKSRCYSAEQIIKGRKYHFKSGADEAKRKEDEEKINIEVWVGCKHDLAKVRDLAAALRGI